MGVDASVGLLSRLLPRPIEPGKGGCTRQPSSSPSELVHLLHSSFRSSVKAMNSKYVIRVFLALTLPLWGAASLSADVVETASGARIVGKVVKVDGGKVVVETDYADTITIKQSAVLAIKYGLVDLE